MNQKKNTMHNVLWTLKSVSLALLLSLWLTTAGIWHDTIEICPSNECLSYLNLSMKASHVLKPHQHLGDNLWLDSDADKRTIMQTWNQFTSLENCQGRFVFKSRFNFKGLWPTWHWPHPHFVVPASQECMELHGSSWAARWVYHQAPNSPSDSRPREHQRMVLSFSNTVALVSVFIELYSLSLLSSAVCCDSSAVQPERSL